MRYIAALFVLCFTYSVQAGEWRKGDVVRINFICKEVDPHMKFLSAPSLEAASEVMMKHHADDSCNYFQPGEIAVLVEKIAKKKSVWGSIGEVWLSKNWFSLFYISIKAGLGPHEVREL